MYFQVFHVTALVGTDGNAVGVFLERGIDHFCHRTIVAEMDDLNTLGLQDTAHDVDGCIMAVKQAGRSDKPQVVGDVCRVFQGFLLGFTHVQALD